MNFPVLLVPIPWKSHVRELKVGVKLIPVVRLQVKHIPVRGQKCVTASSPRKTVLPDLALEPELDAQVPGLVPVRVAIRGPLDQVHLAARVVPPDRAPVLQAPPNAPVLQAVAPVPQAQAVPQAVPQAVAQVRVPADHARAVRQAPPDAPAQAPARVSPIPRVVQSDTPRNSSVQVHYVRIKYLL